MGRMLTESAAPLFFLSYFMIDTRFFHCLMPNKGFMI